MKTEMILKSSFLDILFEHRNKNYGAYQLRKTYKQRLAKALCTTIAGTLILMILLTSFTTKNERIITTLIPPPIEILKPTEEKPKDKTKEKPQKHNDKVLLKLPNTKPLLTNEVIPITPKINDDTKGSINGNSNDTSSHFTGPTDGPPNEDTGKVIIEKLIPILPTEVEDNTMHTDDVDEDAIYNGGKNAFATYLQDKLGDEALQDDEPKKITVQFIVEKDGSITNVKAINNEDVDFIRKTEKAFAKMKNWKPAKIKNKAVRSYHSIPVTIALPE